MSVVRGLVTNRRKAMRVNYLKKPQFNLCPCYAHIEILNAGFLLSLLPEYSSGSLLWWGCPRWCKNVQTCGEFFITIYPSQIWIFLEASLNRLKKNAHQNNSLQLLFFVHLWLSRECKDNYVEVWERKARTGLQDSQDYVLLWGWSSFSGDLKGSMSKVC